MLSEDTDSTMPRMLSISDPSEPSFLRAAAVTLEASWPPCGNFTFLSCHKHLNIGGLIHVPIQKESHG